MYLATIYFLGKHRPLYLEDDSLARLKIRVNYAVQDAPAEMREFFARAIPQCFESMKPNHPLNYTDCAMDHCNKGLAIRKNWRDGLSNLNRAIEDMPACPGLNYNA